jgi:hypothetical protein
MTMLNAAPTAASVPTGTTAASAGPTPALHASPVTVPAQPTAAQHHEAAREQDAKNPEFHILGSGGTPGATGVADRPNSVSVPLDQFSRQSGPDASVKTATGVVSVHAVFQLDAKTRELSVAIVNEDGQLVRLIPPESVARMIAAMATYRGR